MNRIQSPIFELENVRVIREGGTTLKISRFQFHRGTIYGIVGPVGSGKTTLLECLVGRLKPTEGKILYENEKYAKSWLGKLKIPPEILFFEQIRINSAEAVREYVQKKIPDRVDYVRRQYYSRVPLNDEWKMPMQGLSKGQSLRLNLIVAIESDPKVLIIDDYGSNFDSKMKREFNRGLAYSARSRGATIILATADMGDVRSVASVVVALDNGHISKVRSLKKQS
ncbi:MAG: ATP-binding cassette domain-containing protein [Candidatus Neomarinimicrobiota bacterium]